MIAANCGLEPQGRANPTRPFTRQRALGLGGIGGGPFGAAVVAVGGGGGPFGGAFSGGFGTGASVGWGVQVREEREKRDERRETREERREKREERIEKIERGGGREN
jgi:hypothetical protein